MSELSFFILLKCWKNKKRRTAIRKSFDFAVGLSAAWTGALNGSPLSQHNHFFAGAVVAAYRPAHGHRT
jgi:hypothetical protein